MPIFPSFPVYHDFLRGLFFQNFCTERSSNEYIVMYNYLELYPRLVYTFHILASNVTHFGFQETLNLY